MYRQLSYQSIFIFILLTLYCYASPIDQDQQSEMIESIMSNHEIQPKVLNEIYRFKSLCGLYGGCNDDDINQKIIDYDDGKQKRLSSSLFHGIPKFGKRAFSSAFAGLPKFG